MADQDLSGASERRQRGWWGAGGDYWDQQGCLGCGPAWWVIAGVLVFIIWIWGWGWPGFGGWGGWGWRHGPGTATTTSAPVGWGNVPAAPPNEPGGQAPSAGGTWAGGQNMPCTCTCPPPEGAPARGTSGGGGPSGGVQGAGGGQGNGTRSR